jgi:DNA damage-binding protein 1
MSVQQPLLMSVAGSERSRARSTDSPSASRHYLATAQPSLHRVTEHGSWQIDATQAAYIKSAVYGGLDGIITSFSTVSTVHGAGLPTSIIVVIGLSHLVACGLSMGIGDVLSVQSENDLTRNERRRAMWELRNYPEGEVEEMIELYEAKGIERSDAELVIRTLAKYQDAFVDIQMIEQLNLQPETPDREAQLGGVVTLCSFVLFGFVPLLPQVLALLPGVEIADSAQLATSSVLAVVTMFIIGAIKSRVVGTESWYWSGVVMASLGSLAAMGGFGMGYIFSFTSLARMISWN